MTEFKYFMNEIKIKIQNSMTKSLTKKLMPYYIEDGIRLSENELETIIKNQKYSKCQANLSTKVKSKDNEQTGYILGCGDSKGRKIFFNTNFISINGTSFNIINSIKSQLSSDIAEKQQSLEEFIEHIAESSILVYDNEFSHTLIPFKDIDFSKGGHPLKSKYVNIIIHYRDNDTIDTLLDIVTSLKKGLLSMSSLAKSSASSDNEGCGLSGTKCLTPRLTIKCFQLLTEELIKSMYKPDGSITTVSLGNDKGFMTQRYEKISGTQSSSLNRSSKSSKIIGSSRSGSRRSGSSRRTSTKLKTR